jgi:hypothetical protein
MYWHSLKAIDDKQLRDVALKEFRKNMDYKPKVFMGKLRNEQTGLFLFDKDTNPRIRIYMDSNGNPKLEFLDENGVVDFSCLIKSNDMSKRKFTICLILFFSIGYGLMSANDTPYRFKISSSKMESESTAGEVFICKLLLSSHYLQSGLKDEDFITVNELAKYLTELGEASVLVLAGRTKLEVTDPENFGIIVFKVNTIKEVESIRDNDLLRLPWAFAILETSRIKMLPR